jgi:hypothetical protein
MADQPADKPAEPLKPTWMLLVGALFGAITLIALFVFAFVAGSSSVEFLCRSYPFMTMAFPLGAALSAGFIGGHAATTGSLGLPAREHVVGYSAGGGIAVLFIALLVMYFIKPTDCQQKMALHVKNINSEFIHVLKTDYWHKSSLNVRKPIPHELSILINDETRDGAVEFSAENDTCVVDIDFTPLDLKQYRAKRKNDPSFDLKAYPYSEFGHDITLWFVDPRNGDRKENKNYCLRYGGNPVKTLAIAYNQGQVFFLELSLTAFSDEPQVKVVEEDNTHQAGGIFNFSSLLYSRAWAEASLSTSASAKLPFDVLKENLKSSDLTMRVNARQYLEKNFAEYAQFAVPEIMRSDAEPEYLVSLMHGLIGGIDQKTQGQIAPGQKRDLSKIELPYIGDNLAKIVELTAHEDEGVRKQARRLIQRYPVDGFAKYFETTASQCQNQKDQKSELIAYSSIFYYYNRILQNYYSRPLSPKKIDENIDLDTKTAHDAAAKCLSPELKIDAAVIDYGRAIVYNELPGFKWKSKDAAGDFLTTVSGPIGDQYYIPAHKQKMELLIQK